MQPARSRRPRSGPDVGIRSSDVWRRAAAASTVGILVLVLAACGIYYQELEHREDLLRGEGRYLVSLEQEFLAREIRSVRSDLLFLAQQPNLARLVAGELDVVPALEREYAGFAGAKPLYDQIRFLDDAGDEVVRINRRAEQVQIVQPEQLQPKATRYYFRQAIGLAEGEVFVSPLDLNVERGEIELPPRPVIRLATPVVSRAGDRRGLLVLNYAGAKLLGELRDIAGSSPGELMLVNQEGEYLQAPDASQQWGWLLGHSASFRDQYPVAWKGIESAARTQLQIGDDLFTAERVSLAGTEDASASAVFIVSRIPISETIDARGAARFAALLLLIAVGIVAVSFYWARATTIHRDQEKRIAASEARLRVLSSRLLAAQEDERRSLSRALHDELGQRVTAIALDLKAALRSCEDAASESALDRAMEQTHRVLASIHEIATRLRPSVLDDLGLVDAIESHASQYEQRSGISVATELDAIPEDLDGTIGENLYRIVQEALSNVAAHADTDRVRVALTSSPGSISLTVEDRGRGFDIDAVKSSSRLGILGMRERVELLGGRFEIDTARGRGTRLHVELPLDREPEDPSMTSASTRATA